MNEIYKQLELRGLSHLSEWLNKRLSKLKVNPSVSDVEHVLDWIESEKPEKIEKMTWKEAKSATDKWVKSMNKKGEHIKESKKDTELVLDFKDGFRFVKLVGEKAYQREGYLMRHCVASYFGKDDEIYSLRDKDNIPHATLSKSSQQIKGKGNGSIHPKYVKYVVEFLEHIGVEVRDDEMKNLGYVNIEKLTKEIKNTDELFKGKYWNREATTLIGKDGKEYYSLDLLDHVDLVEEASSNLLKISFNLNNFIGASFDLIWKSASKILNKGNASSGDYTKNASSGYCTKNASSGDYTQNASSGDYTQNASSGDYTKNASSGYCTKNASSGDYTQNASSGDYTQNASSGYCTKNEMLGKHSVSVDAGHNGKVKGKIGCWFALTEWVEKSDHWEPLCVKAFKIDGKKVKEDTWYTLKDGELVETDIN